MASPSSGTNIMLSINEKKTVTIDLYRPLRNYIVANYSERQAQTLEDDLETLKQIRISIERSTTDSLTSRRDLYQTYFKALTAVESRFPISSDKDHVNSVTFTWYDSVKTISKASQQNTHLEKAAVLFNLGAVFNQIGLGFDRSTVEGRRQAVQSFTAAAGLTQRLPAVRFGFVHVVNNDYTEWQSYAIGGADGATIISQGNRFKAADGACKEITKREQVPESIWRKWTWRSDGDLLLNGAYFRQSGNPHWAEGYKGPPLIPAQPAANVAQLTKFVGASLNCKAGAPC